MFSSLPSIQSTFWITHSDFNTKYNCFWRLMCKDDQIWPKSSFGSQESQTPDHFPVGILWGLHTQLSPKISPEAAKALAGIPIYSSPKGGWRSSFKLKITKAFRDWTFKHLLHSNTKWQKKILFRKLITWSQFQNYHCVDKWPNLIHF